MKYRSTVVYLLAALLLGGLHFWFTHREKAGTAREEKARTLFNLNQDELRTITLDRSDGTGVIVVERLHEDTPGMWTVTSPVETGADHYAVNRIAGLLPVLSHVGMVHENPPDPEAFGLRPPALRVSWKTRDKKAGALLIGDQGPLDRTRYYAATDSGNAVFFIGIRDREILDKGLIDLRDRRLFTLPWESVIRFTLQGPHESFSFSKSGETMWVLEDEPETPVDSERISAVVRRLTWEEAVSFQEEPLDDPGLYGLEPPEYRVSLCNGTQRQELLIGSSSIMKDERPLRHARPGHRPEIVTVREALPGYLPASRSEVLKKETE